MHTNQAFFCQRVRAFVFAFNEGEKALRHHLGGLYGGRLVYTIKVERWPKSNHSKKY